MVSFGEQGIEAKEIAVELRSWLMLAFVAAPHLAEIDARVVVMTASACEHHARIPGRSIESEETAVEALRRFEDTDLRVGMPVAASGRHFVPPPNGRDPDAHAGEVRPRLTSRLDLGDQEDTFRVGEGAEPPTVPLVRLGLPVLPGPLGNGTA